VIVGMKLWAIATAHRDAGSLVLARRRRRAHREDPHPWQPAPSGPDYGASARPTAYASRTTFSIVP
jgi:hypothetical protein